MMFEVFMEVECWFFEEFVKLVDIIVIIVLILGKLVFELFIE